MALSVKTPIDPLAHSQQLPPLPWGQRRRALCPSTKPRPHRRGTPWSPRLRGWTRAAQGDVWTLQSPPLCWVKGKVCRSQLERRGGGLRDDFTSLHLCPGKSCVYAHRMPSAMGWCVSVGREQSPEVEGQAGCTGGAGGLRGRRRAEAARSWGLGPAWGPQEDSASAQSGTIGCGTHGFQSTRATCPMLAALCT